MSDIPHRDKDEKKMTAREAAIEAAAKHIYEAKGDRLGKEYIGWDKEPDEVKADWLLDVRETIDAYESASPAGEEMWNAAIEEAARVADNKAENHARCHGTVVAGGYSEEAMAAVHVNIMAVSNDIAAAIRALKRSGEG